MSENKDELQSLTDDINDIMKVIRASYSSWNLIMKITEMIDEFDLDDYITSHEMPTLDYLNANEYDLIGSFVYDFRLCDQALECVLFFIARNNLSVFFTCEQVLAMKAYTVIMENYSDIIRRSEYLNCREEMNIDFMFSALNNVIAGLPSEFIMQSMMANLGMHIFWK